ncbi:MAG: hypothetical protein WC863_02030 [Patescibacteria group bacterium]
MAKSTEDTLAISNGRDIEIIVQQKTETVLKKFKIPKEISEFTFSDSEKIALSRGETITRQENLWYIFSLELPFFGFKKVNENNYYQLASGVIQPKLTRTVEASKIDVTITFLIYCIIIQVVFFIFSNLNLKIRNKKVAFFIGSSLIFPILGMFISFFLCWLAAFIRNDFALDIIIFLFVGAVTAIITVAVPNIASDDREFGPDVLAGIMISLLMSMYGGCLAYLNYSLFGKEAADLWIYLGLYLTICLILLTLRLILAHYRGQKDQQKIEIVIKKI